MDLLCGGVRTEAQNCKVFGKQARQGKKGFLFYRSINRMHSLILRDCIKKLGGMVERLGDGENFSAGFCKARLVK